MDWISVEEQLPQIEKNTWRTELPVNVLIEGFGQYICYPCQYSNSVFFWKDALIMGNGLGEHPPSCDRNTEVIGVTHWQPLPEPLVNI